jgi:predicted amidohydrolase
MSKIVFGGAQIPVTDNINDNIINISKAIEWAADNQVDYLLTPEGSLSGYVPSFNEMVSFEEIRSALDQVVDFAASKNVGLILGTKIKDEEDLVYNQLRVYDKAGVFQGAHDKMYGLPEYDRAVPPIETHVIDLVHEGKTIKILGLLCNDFWGHVDLAAKPLPEIAKVDKAHVIMHSSNGFRGFGLSTEDVLYEYHNAVVRLYSQTLRIPILTVDNCWFMHGQPYEGRTSSRSGAIHHGEWLTEEKNTGTEYFKLELDLDKLLSREYEKDKDLEIKQRMGIQAVQNSV